MSIFTTQPTPSARCLIPPNPGHVYQSYFDPIQPNPRP